LDNFIGERISWDKFVEEHKGLSFYLNLFIFKVEDDGRVCFSYDIWHRDVGLENK